MAIVQQISLNMIPQNVPVIVPVNQYDTGTGRLVIKLYKDLTEYTPTNATVKIQGTKPDKHGFQYDATISGNTVTADLTQQMSAVPGDTRVQVLVTESTGVTGTFVFILRVQESALEDDTIISDTELPDIIDTARSYAERAEDASLHPPYVGENGNWYVYDTTQNEWVDSGVSAEGNLNINVEDSCLSFVFS